MIGIALELDVAGQRVAHAVSAMLDAGALGELLDLLHAAPDPRGVVATGVWRQILERDPLHALLTAPRLDNAVIRRLVAREGTAAVPAILAALDACGEGSRLERLMSYLLSIGPDAAPLVAEHLTRAAAPLARELLAGLAKLAPLCATGGGGPVPHALRPDAAARGGEAPPRLRVHARDDAPDGPARRGRAGRVQRAARRGAPAAPPRRPR